MLTVAVVKLDKATLGIQSVQDHLKDLKPFWRDIFAPKYFGMVQDLFATGGRQRGGGGRFKSGAWPRLSVDYAKWKRKHYPGKGILVREGDLQESVRWGGTGLGAGGIFIPTNSAVTAGTSIPYGRFHNKGTNRLPVREFLPTPDPVVFAPLLKTWLLRDVKKAP